MACALIAMGVLGLAVRTAVPTAGPSTAPSATSTGLWPSASLNQSTPNEMPRAIDASRPESTSRKFSPLDTMTAPVFRANEQGDLIIDSQALADIERINAVYGRQEALDKLASYSQDLPPQARQELRNLSQRYDQYSQALTQAVPHTTSDDNPTIDDIAQQLHTLHELRQNYFGADANAMWGQEEEATEKMIALMRQMDPSMPLHERAAMAQSALTKAQKDTGK
jgi:hypothetical protein